MPHPHWDTADGYQTTGERLYGMDGWKKLWSHRMQHTVVPQNILLMGAVNNCRVQWLRGRASDSQL